jgi:hypothetical protein
VSRDFELINLSRVHSRTPVAVHPYVVCTLKVPLSIYYRIAEPILAISTPHAQCTNTATTEIGIVITLLLLDQPFTELQYYRTCKLTMIPYVRSTNRSGRFKFVNYRALSLYDLLLAPNSPLKTPRLHGTDVDLMEITPKESFHL